MRSIPYTISWKGQLLNKARKTLNTHFWRQSATKTTHATSTGRCLIADFPTKAEASNHQRCWEQFPICWKLSRPMIIDLASTWLGFVDWIDQCHDYDLMIYVICNSVSCCMFATRKKLINSVVELSKCPLLPKKWPPEFGWFWSESTEDSRMNHCLTSLFPIRWSKSFIMKVVKTCVNCNGGLSNLVARNQVVKISKPLRARTGWSFVPWQAWLMAPQYCK